MRITRQNTMVRGASLGVFALFCALFIGPFPAQAQQYVREAEQLFQEGLQEYQKGRFSKARGRFQKVLELPLNPRSSAAQLLLGRTLFRFGHYEQALEAAMSLEAQFPQSRYLAEARLLAGDCYYQLRRYYEAAAQYGRILVALAPLPVQAQAAERLAAIVKNGQIDSEGLANLRREVGKSRLREALLYGEARWYQRLGWEAQSRVALQIYRDSVPHGGLFTSLGGIEPGLISVSSGVQKQEAASQNNLRPRLGLLLPLSGAQRQLGEDLYAGVQLANEELGRPFDLAVADIGRDYGGLPLVEGSGNQLLRVVRQTRRLIEEEKVVGIVGPVFSDECVAAAAVSEEVGVPLIAPLAQQSGLDSLGRCIFQLNAIPQIQGEVLAEYATEVMGFKRLAVLAPLTDYGWNFAQEFARVVRASGGEVVYLDWYVPNETKDFKRFFEEMRRVGLSLQPPVSGGPVDSLSLPADSIAVEELLPNSPERFVDAIEGMAIVVESFDDAKTIAPQVSFYRLRTQILGNDLWYEPEAMRLMSPEERVYLEGTILVSGYLESNPATQAFREAFRQRFSRDSKYAAYGYDAARLVMTGWAQGQRDSAALCRWLAGVHAFDGASGLITFSPERRYNSELILLKIDPRGWMRVLSYSHK